MAPTHEEGSFDIGGRRRGRRSSRGCVGALFEDAEHARTATSVLEQYGLTVQGLLPPELRQKVATMQGRSGRRWWPVLLGGLAGLLAALALGLVMGAGGMGSWFYLAGLTASGTAAGVVVVLAASRAMPRPAGLPMVAPGSNAMAVWVVVAGEQHEVHKATVILRTQAALVVVEV